MEGTKTISIKKEFTQDELNEIAMEIAEKVKEFYALEYEKKGVVAKYSSQLKLMREDIENKGRELSLGYRYEERTCTVEDDYDLNVRNYYDEFGTLVKSEPLNGEGSLFEKEAV